MKAVWSSVKQRYREEPPLTWVVVGVMLLMVAWAVVVAVETRAERAAEAQRRAALTPDERATEDRQRSIEAQKREDERAVMTASEQKAADDALAEKLAAIDENVRCWELYAKGNASQYAQKLWDHRNDPGFRTKEACPLKSLTEKAKWRLEQ